VEETLQVFHEELPPNSTPPAVMEMNVMGLEEGDHRTPTEKDLQDLLGCAQVRWPCHCPSFLHFHAISRSLSVAELSSKL
jgi:hypothetical protein